MNLPEIFETYNSNGEYTNKYRISVSAPHYKAEILHFDLPGRGGAVTKKVAAKVAEIMVRGGDIKECVAAGATFYA